MKRRIVIKAALIIMMTALSTAAQIDEFRKVENKAFTAGENLLTMLNMVLLQQV